MDANFTPKDPLLLPSTPRLGSYPQSKCRCTLVVVAMDNIGKWSGWFS